VTQPPWYPPPPQGYPPPPPGYPPQQLQDPYGYPTATSDGLGTAAMVLGIIGVVTAFGVIGVVPSILALIFGITVRKRATEGRASNGGQALAGLILGIVGIVISIAMFVAFTLTPDVSINCQDLHQNQNQNQNQFPFDNCSN
jgi:hypothetical protein